MAALKARLWLDGPLAPISCASKSAYVPCQDCEDLETCAVRRTMSRVRDAMSDILDRMTLAEMVGTACPSASPAGALTEG